MIFADQRLSLTDISDLERRFDGPLPAFLLKGCSDHSRQRGGEELITEMADGFRREIWRHLQRTRMALAISDTRSVKFYREHLDAAARNLASTVTTTRRATNARLNLSANSGMA
jgi:hypothetical protein